MRAAGWGLALLLGLFAALLLPSVTSFTWLLAAAGLLVLAGIFFLMTHGLGPIGKAAMWLSLLTGTAWVVQALLGG